MILRIRQPNRPERTITLEENRGLRFGSDSMNDVVIDSPEAQPLHFGISFKENAFYATASSMAKSISINGVSLPKAKLKPNDRIELGPVKITIEPDELPGSTPAAEEDDFGLLLEEEIAPAKPAVSAAPPPKPTQHTEDDDDEFGLAPLDDAPKPTPKQPAPVKPTQPAQSTADDDDIFGLSDEPEIAKPAKPAPATNPTTATNEPDFGLDSPRQPVAGQQDAGDFGLDPLGSDPLGSSGLDDSEFGSDFMQDVQADIATSGMGQAGSPLQDPLLDPLADPLTQQQMYQPGGMPPQMMQPQEPGIIGKFFASPITQAAIGLVVLGVATAIVIGVLQNQPKAEDYFELADADFAAQRYPQASERFQVFLTYYPAHMRADEARVKRGLADWVPVAEKQGDLNQSLEIAQLTLDDWGGLSRHPVALKYLPDLLIPVAEGLVDRLVASSAASADDLEAQITAAKQAVALVRVHVPLEIQLQRGVDQLTRKIRTFLNSRQETELLEKSISEIQAAVASGSLDDAYKVRETLLNDFPHLASRSTLYAAMNSVSEAEGNRVQASAPNQSPISQPVESGPFAHEYTIVTNVGSGGRNDQTIPVSSSATGSLFMLDAGSGELLWRKFLGNAFFATIDSNDVIAIDSNREELLRLEAKTGKALWRQSIPNFIGEPTIANETAWMAASDGTLFGIETATGTLKQQYSFPQSLAGSPGFDPANNRAYQVGNHSHLYVVDTQTQRCVETVYLGHSPGSVVLPPLVMQQFVLIFEELGLVQTRVHVFTTRGKTLRKLQTIEIDDLVSQSPLQHQQHLFLLTNSGLLQTYKLVPDDAKRPLQAGPDTQIARSGEPGFIKIFSTPTGDELWTAGDEVRGFELPPRPDRLVLKYRFALNGLPTQAPARFGEQVIAAHAEASFGVRVCAGSTVGRFPGADVDSLPLELDRWQSHVASPAALVDAAQRSPAQVHGFGATQIGGKLAAPIETFVKHPFDPTGVWENWDAETAIYLPTGGTSSLLRYDGSAFQVIPLPGTLAARPVRWGNELLVPLHSGIVFLFDPINQQTVGNPLFVPNSPEAQWKRAAILSSDVAVLCDGDRLIRVQRTAIGLEAVGLEALEQRCATSLAAAGGRIWFGNVGGRLNSYDGQTLQSTIEARLLFGPQVIGETALACSSLGTLYGLTSQTEPSWQARLSDALPAGATEIDANTIAVALTDGTVLFLRNGEIVGDPLELGQSVTQAPVFHGKRLLIPTADGSYYSTTQLP